MDIKLNLLPINLSCAARFKKFCKLVLTFLSTTKLSIIKLSSFDIYGIVDKYNIMDNYGLLK